VTRPSTEEVPTAPELFVPDVQAAVDFYCGKLRFQTWRVEKAGERAVFAVLWLERSVVLIADERMYAAMGGEPVEPRGRGIDIRIMVADVDAMHRRAQDGGLAVVHDIADREYGLRDFIVQDPWGFRWRFAAELG
jgi:uncharacterized glyoxalase superfamily protein PhnB